MPMNAAPFAGPKRDATFLAARGWDDRGERRSGGLVAPGTPVTLAPGTVLLRTYHDPRWLFGQWWVTPHEAGLIIGHFAVAGPALARGRSTGKGVLHATFAVRHEWGGSSPEHLGLIAAARTLQPLLAFYGEGDCAPDATRGSNLKPAHIQDRSGRRRAARQVFLPEAWTHPTAFAVLERDLRTDRDLERLAWAYGAVPQAFEA